MRSAWVRILPRKRWAVSGSSIAPSSSASTKPADRGERRAQLVGGVGHEVAPDALEALALGRVVEGEDGAVRGSLLAGEGHAGDGEDAPQVEELHLGLAPLPRPQHLLDERADLALADDLEVVAAGASRRSRAFTRLGLARITVPRWSTARTPSSIADRMASVRPRSRAISAIRSCSWSADWLMMRASSPSSSSRRTGMRAERLPCAYCRAVSMISRSERASEDESSTERPAVARSARARASAPARHRLRLCSSIVSIPRETRATPTTRPPTAHRHRGVEKLGSHGGAAPLGARRRSGQRGLDLGPVGVVRHALERLPGGRGVGEDPAVGEITVTRAFTSRAAASTIGSSVSALVPAASACSTTRAMRRASAVRVANASSRARRSSEGPARSEEDGQGHPRRHHRRQDHAPAERQASSHLSSSRDIR